MRALVQRVSQADVQVAGTTIGAIQRGLLVLLGVREGDTAQDAEYLASKIVHLRIFEDAQGKMNRDAQDIQGETFVDALMRYGIPVAKGVFGEHMAVSLINDGPVTLMLESP